MVGRLPAKIENIPNIIFEHAALQAGPGAESITFNVSMSHLGRSGISRIWDKIAPGTVEYAPPTLAPSKRWPRSARYS